MLKKLRTSLILKLTSLLLGTLFFLYFVSYVLLKKLIIQYVEEPTLSVLMSDFNDMWITIAFVFVGFFIFEFLVLRFIIGKVTDEIDDINSFLEEINKKNYDAVLKIEHHLEFLQLSLLLKNIVKRLKSKKK